jgi:hypothetical protein
MISQEKIYSLSVISLCTSWIPILGWLFALTILFMSFKSLQKNNDDQGFILAKKSLRNAAIAIFLIPLSFIIYGLLGFLGLQLVGMN